MFKKIAILSYSKDIEGVLVFIKTTFVKMVTFFFSFLMKMKEKVYLDMNSISFFKFLQKRKTNVKV